MRILIIALLTCASLVQAFNSRDWTTIETRVSEPSVVSTQTGTEYYWSVALRGADVRTSVGVQVDEVRLINPEEADKINDIAFDSDERVWSVAETGVYSYDILTKEIISFAVNTGKNSFHLEIDGKIAYVGGEERSVSFPLSSPEEQSVFFDGFDTRFGMVLGKDNIVWALLGDTAIGYIADGQEYIVNDNDIPSTGDYRNFRSMTSDKDGNIFVSSNHDVLTNKTGEWILAYDGQEEDGVIIGSELTVDRDGNIWSLGGSVETPSLLKINASSGELEQYPIEDIPWIAKIGGTQLSLDGQGRLIIAANKVVATYNQYEMTPVISRPSKSFVYSSDNQSSKVFNLKGQRISRDKLHLNNFSTYVEGLRR